MKSNSESKKINNKSNLVDLSTLTKKKLPSLTEFKKIKSKVSKYIDEEIKLKEDEDKLNLFRELLRENKELSASTRY